MTVIFCYRYENKHAFQTPDTIRGLTTVARNNRYENCRALQSLGFTRGPHDGRSELPS